MVDSETRRRLLIIKGDITLLPLREGGLVNPSNTGLILSSGVGQAIARRAGPFIQQTLHTARSRLRGGRLDPGHVLDTEPGQLNVKRLLHVAIIGARRVNDRLIQRSLINVYDAADRLELGHLAIPPFGYELGKFPLDRFLEIFWRITSEELPRTENIEQIYLCLADDDAFQQAHEFAEEHVDELDEEIELEVVTGGISMSMLQAATS